MLQQTGSPPADAGSSAAPRTSGEAKPLPVGGRPFGRFEWMLAARYIRPRRRATGLIIAIFSLLGIMIGVAALIIIMAVMNGFRAELINKILGLQGHFLVQPMDAKLTDYRDVADRIAKVPGVISVVPFVQGQALASGESTSSGVQIRGIRESDLPKIEGVANNIKVGTTVDFDQSDGVLIGAGLASMLGLTAGSDLTLVTPRGNVTPLGVTPRIKAYPVVATFEMGMYLYDSTVVFMPFAEAQAYFNLEDEASAIEIYLEDPNAIDSLRPAIEEAAGRQILLTDWKQRDSGYFSVLAVERNVMFAILLLIILVAALNIISGLTMLVKDKARDIAILRTMGATRASIMRVFFIAGASIGTIGTALGVILGVVVCLNIDPITDAIAWVAQTEIFPEEFYFLSTLPADMDPRETILVVVLALVLSYAATIWPAWRAARLDPVEGLRNA